MNSFYGGREGAPFIIRKSYIDVPTMIEDFGRGLSNSEVRFGEFVIINTEDKNHPDNGKVFRRNFMGGNIDYYNAGKDEKGNYIKVAEVKNGNGAELIGTIVGPAGAAPHFQPVPFTRKELQFNEYGEPVLDEDGIQIEEEKTYTLAELMEKYSAYDTTSGSGSFEKLPTTSLNMTLEAVSLLTTDTTGLDILEEFKNKINELITALKNEGLIA